MEKVQLSLEVSKETYEVGKGIQNLIVAMRQSLADGWQPGSDLPMLIASAVQELGPMIQGYDKISEEAKQDIPAFYMALGVGMGGILGEIRKPV